MTVTTTTTYSELVGNGSATAFPFTFAAPSADEVKVSLDSVVQSGGYTVALATSGTGGTVTFDAAPADSVAVLIESDPDFTQESSFSSQGDFNPATFDRVHDRLTAYALWLRARVAMLFPFSFPATSARAGKFLGFDADGNGVLLSGTGNDSAFRADAAASTGSSLIGFQQSGTGAAATTVAAAVKSLGITAAEFGITFSGTDESAKLQAAIDAGHANKQPVLLYGGTIGIGAPIDLRGRYVDIRGAGKASTVLLATAAIPYMLRCDETVDVIDSPFTIDGLRIDGDGKAAVGILIQHRHYTALRNLTVQTFTDACIREKDAWNNYRELLSVYGAPVCVDLVGSNHSSKWVRCGLANATDTHLRIGAAGTALDGNNGLSFDTCDIEFGGAGGKGITVASGAAVTLDTCYVGENIYGCVLENSGQLMIRGGFYNWGYTADACLTRPLAGQIVFDGARLGAQTFGSMSNIAGLTNGEVDAGSYGTVVFKDCLTGMPSTPQAINGDVIGYLPGRNFGASYGQDFTAAAFDDATVSSAVSGYAQTMTVTSPGTAGVTALRCPLATGWRKGAKVFYALVYQSSVPVQIKLAQSAFGTNYVMGVAPAAARPTTFMVIASTPDTAVYQYVELVPQAPIAGSTLKVYKQAFGDAGFLNLAGGQLGNMGLIA